MTEHKMERIYPDISVLIADAPLTTRRDVKFYHEEPLDLCVEEDRFIVIGPKTDVQFTFKMAYQPGGYYNLIDSDCRKVDSISIGNNDQEIDVIAHELTHAYNYRYRKEQRGYWRIMMKIEENPELQEKLEPIANKLKGAIKDASFSKTLFIIDQAIAYAVGRVYDSSQMYFLPHKFDKACDDLVRMIGIDGARAFVRRKLRGIYETGREGTPLDVEVAEFKDNIKAFFEQMGEPK